MKKKLQGQDNIDVLKTTQKKYQCPSRLNVEIFLEIRQLSRLLMPGQTVQTDQHKRMFLRYYYFNLKASVV